MLIPPGFQQQSVRTSLGTIAYYTVDRNWWKLSTEGNDRPDLVFFHGFGGGSSAFEWSKVYPAFVNEYRVIAPDLIGWGRSEHLTRDYRLEDYLATIPEFLEKTCTQPALVVASSLTAAMVVRVAVSRPGLFRCLILTTPAGLSDFGNDYRKTFFAQLATTPGVDRFLYFAAIATSGGIRNFLEQRQFAQPNRISEDIVAAYLQSAQQPHAEYTALSFVRGDLCFDLSEFMPQLTVPTAILWGGKSQFTGPEIGRRLAESNPTAVRFFEVLDEAGLTPHLEIPAVTIGWLRRFLQELPTAA